MAPERAYQPTLESVRRHPLPEWYDDAKLGIFVHWGLYSVPGWAASRIDLHTILAEGGFDRYFRENPYAEWYLNSMKFEDGPTRAYHDRTFGPDFAYEDFQPIFEREAARWAPNDWAQLFRAAGARYVVLTAKHTDGYLLWPSRVGHLTRPGFQSQRDLVGELVAAARASGLRAGLYYTGGMDWSLNPERLDAPEKIYSTILAGAPYVEYANAHWRELFERYRPAVMWGDIMYVRGADTVGLFAEYYNRVPDGVINDRFATELTAPQGRGLQPPGIHYDFLTPEYAVFDDIATEKWETCRGISNSFGYNRDDDESSYLSADAAIRLLIDVVSKNGNLLLNVGPRADGSIHELQRRCLLGLGAWLDVNGEAIHGSRPWTRAASTTRDGAPVRFTRKGTTLYAILLQTPRELELCIRDLRIAPTSAVRRLGDLSPLPWRQDGADLIVRLGAPLAESAAHTFAIAPTP
jgi:alpha-L-fucosidase